MTAPEDPHWPRASWWLEGRDADGLASDAPLLAVLGAPLSQASHAGNNCHKAPAMVRSALGRFSPFAAGVGWPEPRNVDLSTVRPVDLGDVAIGDLDNVAAQSEIAGAVAALPNHPSLARDPDLLVVVGGDDAVIRPVINGMGCDLGRTALLTLDAHHDVRVYYRNMGPHNGTPVRGLIDDGLPAANVVEVGISSFGNSVFYRAWCDDRGVTVVGAAAARAEGVGPCVARHLEALAERADVIFVDFDLDVLDSAFAPGSFGARPGGLASWELHQAAFAAGSQAKVKGICIVEVDPALDDRACTTVDNAALCLLHAAAGLASRGT